MFDKSFPNRFVRQRNVKSADREIRVLRSDPEGVTLQLRRESNYMQTYLSFPQARELALALTEACEAGRE